MSFTVGGETESGTLAEKISHNQITSADITVALTDNGQNIDLHVLFVGGRVYLGGTVVQRLNLSPQPWVEPELNSPNATLRKLAVTMRSALSAESSKQFVATVDAAKTVTRIGLNDVNGIPATEYHVVVDIDKLRAYLPGGITEAQLKAAYGNAPLTADLWLDSHNRPIQMTETLTIEGETVAIKMNLGSFNQPLTITAPPARQVYTGLAGA